MVESMLVKRHVDLTVAELEAMGRLFDGEYLSDYGRWDPDVPYGYSSADFHVLAFSGLVLAAHVGFQIRVIAVAGEDVVVAGTGGVLVDANARGAGLGGRVMRRAQIAMRNEAKADFGFLGCREEVVPFYESTGWIKIHATERSLSRVDHESVVVSDDGPIMICSGIRHVRAWPPGDIDLRGTPW